MDFNSSVKTLQFYLDNQSFLQKISSLEELEYITTPAISLLLTQKGDLFHLPEDKMFKKGIFFLNNDWIAPEIMSKDRLAKNTIIKSSADLFDSFIENKMIKSGYWDLFNSSPEIELIDSILVLKKIKNSDDNYDLILIKGPMNEKTPSLPSFRHSANLLTEFTYSITPHARPPRFEHFLSYRDLVKSTKLKWSIHQIKAYLESIWCEKTPSTILSRLNILFESSVLFVENNMMFNSFLQVDKEKQARAGIPSNFTIGICGGYARGEYSKNSDLDLLLIHEGNDKLFLQVGEALDQVLRHVSTLELCKMENFKNLNFHENSLSNILEAFLKGDEACLGNYQKKELHNMLDSIETLRQVRLTLEERKDGISKYCWSIYKSIINMVPIYEKPIGKGDYLRNKITQMTKKSLHVIIPILLRVTDSLSDEKDVLGEYLRVSQPYVWDSIFKKYSVLTALQDMSTILAVLCEITFTSSTIDRFKVAMEKNIITKEQAEKFISGYRLFSRIKYKLTNEIPVESLEIINDDIKNTIKEAYSSILQNLEPIESDEESEPIVYPLLVFSDLHWGLNTKLAKKCLTEIKKICRDNQVRSILIAGDVLNIDRVNELDKTDIEGVSLINELSQIQNALGDQRIHILAGNHDPESFYKKFSEKMKRELDIHFWGNYYKDEKIWVAHGDLNFWNEFAPPIDQYVSKFRNLNSLNEQKIIVGHNHRIYEEDESKFFANGGIGKSFSSILVTDDSIRLIKSPVEYSFDFDKISSDYSGIRNADISINDYVQSNFELVEGTQYTSSIGVSSSAEKKTWIVIEEGAPTHIIPFNKIEEVSKLENIQSYEIGFPIHYTFKLDQTLKEAWGVFSISGDSILPVMDNENEIVGTLSIFSIPKPDKEHSKTKEAKIDEEMERVGDFLIQKLVEKNQRRRKEGDTSEEEE